MESTTEFRSPVKKLVRFFKRSRDQWKRKCLEAKLRVKRLQTKVSDLEASREEWKRRTKQAQAEVGLAVQRDEKKSPAPLN